MSSSPTHHAHDIQRFTLQVRVQHGLLAFSVLVLIFSGIPLWLLGNPDLMWWDRESVNGMVVSIGMLRGLHRVAGAVLTLVSVYHMLWVMFTRQGRREFYLLLPRWKDVTDLGQNLAYFLGRRKDRPQFGRYSYYEKFDYWAVYWGCVIMIGTGLALWFDRVAAEHFPWLPYKLAAIVHADEALLAGLALLIWHMYNVHLRPGIFPGSQVWLHGRITKEQQEEEHPLEAEGK
jgi:cytochrome b subunit of formate dehydrogenase